MKMKKIKRTFEERGWNHSLDVPLYLRRGLSGIFLRHKFPGEDKSKPTCIEDCSDGVIRGWLNHDGSIEMARNVLSVLTECYENLFTHLYDDEKKLVSEAIEKRGDQPEITEDSIQCEIVDAVIWYCHIITLIADMFGICSPDTEAQLAYNERTERRKSIKNE